MKPRVYLSRVLPKVAMDMVEKECDMELNTADVKHSKEELISRIKDKEGLLCLLTDKIDAEVLDGGKNLKMVANVAVGFDNIDVKAASQRKIMVTNTPGVLTDTTADLTWALIFATARRIVEADKYLRAGKWKEWGLQLLMGQDIHGKTLGIFGFGRIGRAMAQRASGFNMRVLYSDSIRAPKDVEEEFNATYVTKEELLREADIVCLHVPLTAETRHMIGEKELSMMKPTAVLINTSRGPVIDEKALVDALKKRVIWGAGLDVFEEEPKITPGLTELDNAVLVPHIGSASVETRTRMATMAAENLIAGVKGKRPPNIVNPEVLTR